MKKKTGIITSASMTRTVTVTVHRHALHPKYKKHYRVSKKFLADTGDLVLRVGDLVLIGECRPLSKRKHFRVLEVLKRATEVSELQEEALIEKTIHREKNAPTKEKESQSSSASSNSSASSASS